MSAGSRSTAVVVTLLTVCTFACRPGPSPRASPQPPRNPGWRYETEDRWIAATILESVAALASWAPNAPRGVSYVRRIEERASAPGELRLVARLAPPARPAQAELVFHDHIWSPRTYAPLAARFLRVDGDSKSSSPARWVPFSDQGALAALLDLRAETLAKWNRELSDALEKNPVDPLAHEAAAFLVGTLVLREAAGAYSDSRQELCRISAHLAIAGALRRGQAPSAMGELAEIVLLHKAGRQREALERLDAFRPTSKVEGTWAATLRMAVTEDWRTLPDPVRATLAERLVHFRAVANRLGVDRARALPAAERAEQITDWRRILDNSGVSVAWCNEESADAFAEELAEAGLVQSESAGGGPARAQPPRSSPWSQDPPTSPIVEVGGRTGIQILDVGIWAAFEERHLMAQIEHSQVCRANVWGMPDDAVRQHLDSLRRFESLKLFPFFLQQYAKDRATFERARQATSAELARRPDRVSGTIWARLQYRNEYGDVPSTFPDYGAYFQPRVPFGTAYDVGRRVGLDQAFKSWPSDDYLHSLAALAPYSLALQWRIHMGRLGAGADHADVARAFGSMTEYDVGAAQGVALAAEDHPEAYGRLADHLCSLSPDDCVTYADWLVKQKRDDEAAEVYRRWFREGADRVRVSNGLGWLVKYDSDHGHASEALSLARDAAATYSEAGLLTLARLLERKGDLAGANAYFKRVEERYEAPEFVMGFYVRHKGQASWDAAAQDLIRDAFPSGLKAAALSDFHGAPADGVVTLSFAAPGRLSAVIDKYGIKSGDVIVGVEGYRVQNLRQYRLLNAYTFRGDDTLQLIVWNRGRQYYSVTTREPERHIGPLADYTP